MSSRQEKRAAGERRAFVRTFVLLVGDIHLVNVHRVGVRRAIQVKLECVGEGVPALSRVLRRALDVYDGTNVVNRQGVVHSVVAVGAMSLG